MTYNPLDVSVFELPPEFSNQLTFHLPLELYALRVAGATDDIIAKRLTQRLPHALASGLKDPPFFRWALNFYMPLANALLSGNEQQKLSAIQEIASLAGGLAGGAFHGLIRTGYGVMLQDPKEVAFGLAYMRTRRQVLFPSTLAPSSSSENISLPSKDMLSDSAIYEQLDLASSSLDVLKEEDRKGPLPTDMAMCEMAIELLVKAPHSFIAVHSVTSFHALMELSKILGSQESSEIWRRSWLHAFRVCSLLVNYATKEAPMRLETRFSNFDQMIKAAIQTCEAHDIKIVVALKRLVEFGLVDDAKALEAGSFKLAATECS